MKDGKCIIEVIKKLNPKDIFGKNFIYPSGNPAIICSTFKVGKKFTCFQGQKPENFPCDWAWRDLYKDVAVLRFGGNFNHCEPVTKYTACTDGFKPVVIKLTRDESTYKPGSN